jgi:hypothetical protein
MKLSEAELEKIYCKIAYPETEEQKYVAPKGQSRFKYRKVYKAPGYPVCSKRRIIRTIKLEESLN